MQLLRSHDLSRAASFLLLGGLAVTAQDGAARRVGVSITDCWGNSIQSANVHIASIGPQALYERITYPSTSAFRLRPGRYHALVEAKGFFSSSQIIDVGDNDLELRACLTLAPIEGTTRPMVRVNGDVADGIRENQQALWVRLIGLYSDANSTAAVDSKGRFTFADVRPGRYLIILMGTGGTRATKEVDVREPSALVAIP
jgi:hypothetical protein